MLKNEELVATHKEICTALNEVYEKKNKDYGNSFGETYKKLGIISAVTRIADKMSRLESLATKTEEERLVKDESIQDTVLDMANYCIMLAMELDREREERKDAIKGEIPNYPVISGSENPQNHDLVLREPLGVGTISLPNTGIRPYSIPNTGTTTGISSQYN